MALPGVSRRSCPRAVIAAVVTTLAVGLSWPYQSAADDGKGVDAFLSDLSAQAAKAEQSGRSAIAGADGWLFFVAELRALSIGPFWGERAAAVSRASNSQNADPLAEIVDFN